MDRRQFLIGAATAASVIQTIPAQAMVEVDAGGTPPNKETAIHKIQLMKRQIFVKISKSIGFDKTKIILDDICLMVVRVKPPFALVSDEGKMIYHGLAYNPDIFPKNSFLCDHIEFDEDLNRSFGYKNNSQRHFYTPIPYYDMAI